MTFSRQLIFLLMTVVFLLFVVSLSISFYNTRQFVEDQLASHSQDAATSLGLSSSTSMREGDKAIVRSLVNAMFHSGDYLEVAVFDNQGEVLVQNRVDVKVEGVPAWFINAVPLSLPVGESIVMDGWVQSGKVQVSSHPGYAYRQLWNASIHTFQWFVISALVILMLSLYRLRKLLHPLKQVEEQAKAISNREFTIVEPLPKTLDLKRIVETMNHLGRKVKQMLNDSDALAQKLRDQAHRDEVTGLANRQSFNEILDHRIASSDLMGQGALAIIQLHNFKQFNDINGYAAGDILLRKTGEVLLKSLAGQENMHLAHLAGANFAVLVEDISYQGAEKLAKSLSLALTTLAGQLEYPLMDIGHVGVAYFKGEQTSGRILSMADAALRKAQTDSANGWYLYKDVSSDKFNSITATQWRTKIGQALDQDWLVLQRQAVFNVQNQSVLHEEVYVRLAEDGNLDKLLSAGSFMPMVQNLGLSVAIDKRVLEKVFELLKTEQEGLLAVNISPLSLEDSGFIDWLDNILLDNKSLAKRLILEFPEYGVVNKLDKLQRFHQRIKAYDVKLSLDHFGRGFTSFAYLQSLKLDYLKIDGSYLYDLESSAENRFFVQALTKIAHGLDIIVIGESVETENVWQLLPTLNVDAGQGYYLAKPS